MTSPSVQLSTLQEQILRRIVRQSTSSVREVERGGIILLMHEGASNSEVQRRYGLGWAKAKRWRDRWLSHSAGFRALESDTSNKHRLYDLEKSIRQCLSDEYRSGSPGKFSSEIFCQILGVVLEDPQGESGRPISQWTLDELKLEVEKRGIVETISRSHLGSFLKTKRCETP